MNLRNENEILNAVCSVFGIPTHYLADPTKRVLSLTNARMAYVQILTQRLGLSCIEIGELIKRDRRTAHRLQNQHIIEYRVNASYKEKFDSIVGERKKHECVLTVSETFPNKKKKRGYDGVGRKKHMIKKIVDKMIRDGMITVDVNIDADYNNVYVSKLNIPRSWME